MVKKLHLTLLFFTLTICCFAQDTKPAITPDNFPITNNLLTQHKDAYHEGDHVWFTNTELKQTLVFELGTDYHRFKTYLFYNNIIPEALLNDDWFSSAHNTSNKVEVFKSYIKNANPVNINYFTSLQGIELGQTKKQILKLYPYNPDEVNTTKDIEKYTWNFTGDIMADMEPKIQNDKPLAKDSFGYHFTAYFKNDILVGLILVNDIP
ncbi:hypothetical protein Q763_09295 [Flavobacterium beibuense F44-8]|uniref:FTP domain-containing protein n=1 Tax=Flavobacterium beibuense F44-8 TaxID=1406840 RepID=A0A0A2LX90_9FLAO|nr:hypothetical protein [Flavobacterium beibuense]KGO80725.1 hypothetical protein Q763_09295 [Flavobacterium beibuense F44-8]